MGLLDEAIREHLDLRLRHGADPDEVAREELDALAPVERDERPQRWSGSDDASAEDGAGEGDSEGRVPFDGRRERITGGGPAKNGKGPSRSRDTSFMEETAEIDMRTVLSELEDAMSSEEAGGDTHTRPSLRAERAAPVAAGGARAAPDFAVDKDPRA